MSTDPPEADRPPPLWPPALACAAVALWVDLGSIQRLQHADSLLYAMISRWGWTPFYWGQDRLGMLVPLLARPVADPLANLLLQDFLNIFAGLFAYVLMARFALPDASYPVVGLGAAAASLAFAPPGYQAMYLIDACYGVWLSLGLGALILAERPTPARLAGALSLVLLAHWVNFTTSLILGPLVVGRALWPGRVADGRRRLTDAAVSLTLLAIGVAVGGWLTTLPVVKVATSRAASPFTEWPDAWLGLWSRHREALSSGPLPASIAASALLGLAALAVPATRRRARLPWSAALALAAAAAVVWLYTGTRVWVRLNGYTYRYMIPSSMMVQVAAAGLILGPIGRASGPRVRRGLGLAAASAMLLGAMWTFGPPSPAGVRRDFDRQFGALTPDLLAAGGTHLAGTYDRVWPAAFHAWIALHGRGERRFVWAITGRAEATVDRWRPLAGPSARIAVARGDDRAAVAAFREFDLPPPRLDARLGTIDVYRPDVAP